MHLNVLYIFVWRFGEVLTALITSTKLLYIQLG